MFKLRRSLALFITALSLNTFAATDSTNLILARCVFSNVDDGDQPCVFKSNETMTDWQYNDNFTNLPADRNYIFNNSLICTDNTCLSVGGFNTYKSPYTNTPYVFISNDGGLNWAMKIITLPDSSDAMLGFINCNNGECIAIGTSASLKNKRRPLIFVSHDNFDTWQQITNISNLEPDASIGDGKYACTSDYCVMATHLYNLKNDAKQPFFLFSSNDKREWSAVPIPSNTPFYKRMGMVDVSCSKNTCTAVGYGCVTSGPFDPIEPLLYISHDKGRTWETKEVGKDITLSTVKCQDNYCIAIGTQNENNVVLVTQNEWNTWRVKTLKKPINSDADLTKLDCTSNFCVVGTWDFGRGLRDQNGQPIQLLMYVTHDKGNTWHIIKNIGNLPVFYNAYTRISCNANNCLATVEYGRNDKMEVPIVITSDNTGDNWQVVSNLKNLPNGISTFINSVYRDQSASATRYSSYRFN